MGRDCHILVLEDEPATRELLATLMEAEGFKVTTAMNLAEAYKAVSEQRFDLILLDRNLPDQDGIYLARDLRARSVDVGIIVLTTLTQDVERVIGLEMGADDYITKPFYPRELIARVKGLLRRMAMSRPARRGDSMGGGEFRYFNGWQMDLTKRTLINPHGEETDLTRAEFDLLITLVSNAGRVMAREELLEAIGSMHWTPVDRTVDVLVSRLRKKMESDPKSPTMILTSHGYGYKFAPTVTGA